MPKPSRDAAFLHPTGVVRATMSVVMKNIEEGAP
jgi:hypothetical protein